MNSLIKNSNLINHDNNNENNIKNIHIELDNDKQNLNDQSILDYIKPLFLCFSKLDLLKNNKLENSSSRQNNLINLLYKLILNNDQKDNMENIINDIEKNSNTYLSNITAKNGEDVLVLDPEYDKDITEYNTTVPEGTSTITITATPEVSTTTYKLLDNATIRVGTNTKRVMAIAEDGSTIL